VLKTAVPRQGAVLPLFNNTKKKKRKEEKKTSYDVI